MILLYHSKRGLANAGALAQNTAKVYRQPGNSKYRQARHFPWLGLPGFSAKAVRFGWALHRAEARRKASRFF
jgi:hypothetical protein